MSSVVVIQARAAGGGGTDVTPAAVNWTDISVSSTDGYEVSNEQTFTGIDTSIQVKAECTGSAYLQWIKNGVAVESTHASPASVNIAVNDKAKIAVYNGYDFPSGRFDSGTITVTNQSQKATVTMTIASPAVVTWTGHGLSAGMMVRFSTTGALPTGVTAGTVYFVIASGLSTDEFQFSATSGGSAINSSGTQSGTHTAEVVLDTLTYAVQYVFSESGGSGADPTPPDDDIPGGGDPLVN